VSTLHVTNGSSAGDTLASFVDGPVAITCDVLHEGPAPRVDGDAWYDTRARFLADEVASNVEAIRADLARSDRTILEQVEKGARGERHDIVLWFEHDLFDQLLLIRTLDLIGRSHRDLFGGSKRTRPTERGAGRVLSDPATERGVGRVLSDPATERGVGRVLSDPATERGVGRVLSDPATVSIICIDRFPGVERFIGLGQLTADQLASLYPSRRPVPAEAYAIASEAWDAFRLPDPAMLAAIAVRLPAAARSASSGLPFLGDALRRFLAEYPSTTNGLSRTEELALRALSDASMTAGTLFAATQRQEARPFMGGLPFYDVLRSLASARVPLVALDADAPGGHLGDAPVSITDAGRDVLAGRRDQITLNGIDRWKGGVHLTDVGRSLWRWDAARETLVS
jgi:hypothetical protein